MMSIINISLISDEDEFDEDLSHWTDSGIIHFYGDT